MMREHLLYPCVLRIMNKDYIFTVQFNSTERFKHNIYSEKMFNIGIIRARPFHSMYISLHNVIVELDLRWYGTSIYINVD